MTASTTRQIATSPRRHTALLLEKGRLDPRGMPTNDLDWQRRAARMHSLALDELVARDQPGHVSVSYAMANHEPRATIRIEVLERAEATLRAYVDALGLAQRHEAAGQAPQAQLVGETIAEAKAQIPELLKLVDGTVRATHLAATNGIAEAKTAGLTDDDVITTWQRWATTHSQSVRAAAVARLASVIADRP